ncbi:MAG: histidine decarboxylase [Symploca sp. SIO1B1]|nr:histidine decarboxylase [Symploca sp. SIO1B1]
MKTDIYNALQELRQSSEYMIGYPLNLKFDYSEIFDFLAYHINNIGDPFVLSRLGIDAKQIERSCIQYFAQLYDLPEHWGYITSGGTEGNTYGILMGRELYSDGLFYCSEDSHYSVPKAAYVLNIPHVSISSQANGEINYEHLQYEISQRKQHSAILNLNLGTTMKGAVDKIDRVVDILEKLQVPFHIHCDAALGGMLLPFIDEAPKISFQDYPIGSIAISGHKFFGSPIPYGVLITRKTLERKLEKNIEYIATKDTTITGSRSGLAAILLWDAITTRKEKFAQEVSTCIENSWYLYKRLQKMGYHPMLNDYSTTVVFDQPAYKICNKWHLATQGNLAHIVVMLHVSREKIDRFLDDLSVNS